MPASLTSAAATGSGLPNDGGNLSLMKYRKLGRTNFEVSDIGHGLWGMSGWSGSDDSRSLDALQLGVDLGCNFLDSAWAYGDGRSDGLLGETLRSNAAKRIYAASKVPPKNRRWPATGTLQQAS